MAELAFVIWRDSNLGVEGCDVFLTTILKASPRTTEYDWNKFLWLALADILIHEYNHLGYGAAFVLSFLNLDMEDK